MKTMTATEVKRTLLKVLDEVEAGEKIAITCGRKKEVKAILIPPEKINKRIKLGSLVGKGSFKFIGGHNTTEEEFFGKENLSEYT